MARMRILTANEQEVFDNPPLFDYEQRKRFFSFPNKLLETARTLRTLNSQIGFLLLCGYFKATKRFFLPQDFHQRDINAIAKILNLHPENFSSACYGKTTRIRHQRSILAFYGFKSFDSNAKATLITEIATMAKTYLKPKLIFDRCVDFLTQNRIQVTSIRTLSDLIHTGLQEHKTELVTLMAVHLDDQTRYLLDGLFASPDDQNQHRLTLLKKCQSFLQVFWAGTRRQCLYLRR